MKTALITGVTGQDGSYLAEFLIRKGYIVHGLKRRSSSFNTERVEGIYRDFHDQEARFFMHFADLSDSNSLSILLHRLQPDEIYNLGAQSHVRVSFDIPEYTADITGTGAVRLLEAIRQTGLKARFYQASSSEIFGSSPAPQDENTPFRPRSPYGCAKAFAYWVTVNYRESYSMFAVNGIMFNHESPRRGETFVTRKVSRAVAHIKFGLQDKLYLGNLDARRDWGYAPDYIDAMWLMLQKNEPDDYVIGTGISHSVRDLVELAFDYAGLDWRKHVEVDPRYYRPAEINELVADPAKARLRLGWRHTVEFEDLVRLLVDADMAQLAARKAGVLAPASLAP